MIRILLNKIQHLENENIKYKQEQLLFTTKISKLTVDLNNLKRDNITLVNRINRLYVRLKKFENLENI